MMIKTIYHIDGMTCNGCKAQVTQKLVQVDGVQSATVSLEAKEAIVTSNHNLDIAILRSSLPSKYTITSKEQASKPEKSVENPLVSKESTSKLKQLRPLFLIFTYITAASLLLHRNDWKLQEIMLDFMGLFYIVFSFFKLLDLKGFKESFMMYDPLTKRIPVYGWIYPFIELLLGLCFLFRFQIYTALILTLFILGITTIGVVQVLLNKQKIKCACLGSVLQLPMTEATLIENTIMLFMALVMLVQY